MLPRPTAGPIAGCPALAILARVGGGTAHAVSRKIVDLAPSPISSYYKKGQTRGNCMAIHLSPEQERRLQAVVTRGAYESVEEVVEAAVAAVEQRTVPGFAGTPEELDTLLAEGLASKELTETEFWSSVNQRTDSMLAEHKAGQGR
jgi:Arc/MetJ-type ribon-helix-helix transcriptional regulator